MATRHNACVNPSLANDNAGWGGESTPARTAVTGFDRPFAARYTAGTFLRTAAGSATAGLDYTLSAYVRPSNSFSAGGNAYIEWRDAVDAVISYSGGTYTLTDNVVTRASVTATAPAGTATAQLILDGVNYSVTTVDATMTLVEQATSLLDYFDGDSPGGSWDGTPGSSSSTLTDTISATLSGTLPPFAAGTAGSVTVSGTASATLPALTAETSGGVTASGTAAATLPSLAGDLSGTVEVFGQIDASLPALVAGLTGSATAAADITATLPALTGAFDGQVLSPQGQLAGVLPALQASFSGTSEAVDLDITGLAGPASVGWPVGAPETRFAVGAPYL